MSTILTAFTRSETTWKIFEIVNACTPTQRRRFIRYVVFGYNYCEICEMEHVNNKAIRDEILSE